MKKFMRISNLNNNCLEEWKSAAIKSEFEFEVTKIDNGFFGLFGIRYEIKIFYPN